MLGAHMRQNVIVMIRGELVKYGEGFGAPSLKTFTEHHHVLQVQAPAFAPSDLFVFCPIRVMRCPTQRVYDLGRPSVHPANLSAPISCAILPTLKPESRALSYPIHLLFDCIGEGGPCLREIGNRAFAPDKVSRRGKPKHIASKKQARNNLMTTFSQLGLHPDLVQTVTALGYTQPTPIQAQIIPLMLAGHDVLGQAQTGTGKTAAFALPVLQQLIPHAPHVQALVLAPTRELAQQVARAFTSYGQSKHPRVLAVYGGAPYDPQIRALRRGVDVVVGTPGRLLDLVRRRVIDLSGITTLVLDEADEMLSMGFIEDIETLLEQTPTARQTALFSATLPPTVRKLAQAYMDQPQSVTIKRQHLTVASIDQRYYLVNGRDKLAALTRLFEMEEIGRALIFARTRIGTGELASALSARGFPAEALNGDMSQASREQVLRRFRQGQVDVLVATDVAARGLDIDDITHVFNYDLPQDPEVYVHRIGRTGRAGKTGVAMTLITPKEMYRLRQIQRYTRQPMTQATIPTDAQIHAGREEQLLAQVLTWLKRGRAKREKQMVEALMELGYDPVDIAAAALKLARKEEKQRPLMPMGPVREARAPRDSGKRRGRRQERGRYDKPSTRSHETGMVRLVIDLGREDGLRPNDVVGTLAYQANIPGKTIGKVLIQDRHTLVDVQEAYAGQVLARTEPYRIGRRQFTVSRP